MMSASTIVIKNPPPSAIGSVKKTSLNSTSNNTITVSTLWVISSVYAAARADTSPNATGLLVSVTVQDVILLILTCCLLHISLCKRNFLLATPWVGFMAYTIYFSHYKGLLKMISAFRYARVSSTIPWLTVGFSIALLIIRTFETTRVLQLSTYLWYRKRLEKELCYQVLK